jgi:hypothetical protein
MKKTGINWNWKKVSATVLGGLGIGMLTSCYGMPPVENSFENELWSSEKIEQTEKTDESLNLEKNN